MEKPPKSVDLKGKNISHAKAQRRKVLPRFLRPFLCAVAPLREKKFAS
jgi:hypothetical protein